MKIKETRPSNKNLFAKLPTIVKVRDGGEGEWVVLLVGYKPVGGGRNEKYGTVLLTSDHASSVGYVSDNWNWESAEEYTGEITLSA